MLLSALAAAQDSPGRFEAGGALTGLHMNGTGFFGPAVEGDVNFGRHFALDGTFSWFPARSLGNNTMIGLFGAKAGTRTEHFGFFGKVRPGFMTFDNAFREETLLFSPSPFGFIGIPLSFRFGRLTQRALDLGGVVEYYPARHWAFRWDLGDMLLFQEKGPTTNFIGVGPPGFPTVLQRPLGNRQNFQFSTGIHYRF